MLSTALPALLPFTTQAVLQDAPVFRDPHRDPQVGDVFKKFGAKHRSLYRYVTYRNDLVIKFQTGNGSAEKTVWLPSWQEWAAGADIEQRGEHASSPVGEFFRNIILRDKAAKRHRPD